MSVNERLKQARTEAGHSTAASAAKRLDISYPTYAAHEAGSRGIGVEEITRYASAFGVDRGWLAFGEKGANGEEPTPSNDGNFRLARWVKDALKRRGATQTDLARSMDVASSAVSRFISGERQMSIADLYGVAAFFGIGADQILADINGGRSAPISERSHVGDSDLSAASDLITELQDGRRISRPEATILRRAIGVEA